MTPPDHALEVVLSEIDRVPSSGRTNEREVFISALYKRVKNKLRMTLPDFKRWLIAQQQAGNLQMTRADLNDIYDQRLVQASEVDHLDASFHFVQDPHRDQRARIRRAEASAPTPKSRRTKPGRPTREPKSRAPKPRVRAPRQAGAKTRGQLDREINAALEASALYYPGGDGGGGRRRGRGTAIVLPHPRTSPSCKKCGQYHTATEHKRHGRRSRR